MISDADLPLITLALPVLRRASPEHAGADD
jgi:hypothetical protein